MNHRRLKLLLLNASLGAIAFLYSVVNGSFPNPTSSDLLYAAQVSALETVDEPRFIAFVVTGAWLIYCLIDVRVTGQLPRLIRHGSYSRLVANVALRSLTALIVPAITVSFAAGLAPLLAPTSAKEITESISTVTQSVGLNPGVALLIQVALVAAFLVIVRAIIELLVLLANFGTAVTLCIVMFVWAVLSASGLVANPFVNYCSFVFLSNFVSIPLLALYVALTYSAVILAITGSAFVLDLSAQGRLPHIPAGLAPAGAAFGIILGAMFYVDASQTDIFSAAVSVFFGASGTMTQMLIMVGLLVGYTFAFQFRLTPESHPWCTQTLLRHGSRPRQLRALARAELLRVGSYCIAIVASTIIAYALVGGRDFSLPTEDAALLIFQLTVAQVLQLLFYIGCVTAAVHLFDSTVAGLAAVGVITALSAIPLSPALHLPIQASATALLFDGGWPLAITNCSVLCCGIVIVFALATLAVPLRRRAQLFKTK